MDELKKVFKVIKSEMIYQETIPTHSQKRDEEKSIAEWVNHIRHHLNKADEAIYYLNDDEALKAVRIITALGVQCMKYRGCQERDN